MDRKEKPDNVFVVHGRDERLRLDFFAFLRALGAKPLEWTRVVRLEPGSPYIGALLEKAFSRATAVIVLFSGDDEARLRDGLSASSTERSERRLIPQPRANVLFEAGMAFAHKPASTVLVQVGRVRYISDVAGRYILRLDNTAQRRHALARRLEDLGLKLDLQSDWLTIGDLRPSSPRTRPAKSPSPNSIDKLSRKTLRIVSVSSGGLTITTVATRLGELVQEVRNTIGRLEELGLVRLVRKPKAEPKVRLTPEGRASLRKSWR